MVLLILINIVLISIGPNNTVFLYCSVNEREEFLTKALKEFKEQGGIVM